MSEPTKLAAARARMGEIRSELLPLTEADELTEDQAVRYEELVVEYEAIKPEYDALNERAKRREEITQSARAEFSGVTRTEHSTDDLFTRDVLTMGREAARDGARRILEGKEASRHLTSSEGDAVERAIRSVPNMAERIIVTENEHYRSAFQKLMSDPTAAAYLSDAERHAMVRWHEFRQQVEGDTSGGGYAVPVFIDPSVILVDQESDNPFFAISRVIDVTTNQWKGVSADGIVWSFDDELDEVSDDSIEIAQPTVDVFTARGFIPFSLEIGQDWPGFQAEMGRLLGIGYDELLLESFTNGNGTSAPRGIITAIDATAGSEVVSTTDGAYNQEDIYKVWGALPQKYRRRASWMMSVSVMNKTRQFGTANNFHATTVQLAAGQVETLFNRNVYENDHFPTLTTTTGAENRLIVGDFSNFVIARRSGMTVELVPHLIDGSGSSFPIGARGWFAWARIGSNSVNDEAFRLLQNQ